MGIYDRDYTRARPSGRNGSGPGVGLGAAGFKAWSVNTWIIAINIAVFVVGFLLSNVSVPTKMTTRLTRQLESSEVEQLREADTWLVLNPRNGRAQTVESLKGIPNGFRVRRPLVLADTGETVGLTDYWLMEPTQHFGHFSTSLAFVRFEPTNKTTMELQVWRFITFQFLHAGFMHLAFNMFGMFYFGPMVEEQLGRKRYAAFYLACGMGGAILYLLLNLLGFVLTQMGVPSIPGALVGSPSTPLVGASAGVFGVIMACAYIAPKTIVQLVFPPIALQQRTMAYGFVALAAANLFIFRGSNQGGDAAHLGGAAAGYFFVRRPHLLRDFFDVLGNSNLDARQGGRKKRQAKSNPKPPKRGISEERLDVLLEKVRKDGFSSLSETERRELDDESAARSG